MTTTSFKDTDSYIAAQPENARVKLEQLRHIILKIASGAEEIISYNMPAFRYHGLLAWIAGHKNHIGFYPKASGIAAFKKELSGFKWAKGSIQFPLDKPLPVKLITKIVKYRVKENLEKEKNRRKK